MRRSLLFVPGAEPRKIETALGAGADTLVFDLEDAVAPGEKERARAHVAAAIARVPADGSEPAVRVNPLGGPLFDADLEMVVAAGARAVMVPKCEAPDDVAKVAAALGALERTHGVGAPVRVLALIETAAGIARAATFGGVTPRLDALCFGHVDFARDMGVPHTDTTSGVVHHARCALAIAAKAARLTPIDTVCVGVRDPDTFRADVTRGIRLGYEGKLCVHPAQVPIANEAHTPTLEEIAYAERVLDAARRAEADGRGVFRLGDVMIDAPIVTAQRRILERARRAGVVRDA